MSDDADGPNDEAEEELFFALMTETFAAGYISLLAHAVERGDADLGVDPVAWDNTMAAVDWSLGERVAGRITGPTSVTHEDVARMRQLHQLGASMLAGRGSATEFVALAPRCIESLFGPDCEEAVKQGVGAVMSISQISPPSIRQ